MQIRKSQTRVIPFILQNLRKTCSVLAILNSTKLSFTSNFENVAVAVLQHTNERKTKPWIPTCHCGGELKSMTTENL
jgi:hypothetical protein